MVGVPGGGGVDFEVVEPARIPYEGPGVAVVAAAVASVVVGAAVSRVVLDAPEQEVTLG